MRKVNRLSRHYLGGDVSWRSVERFRFSSTVKEEVKRWVRWARHMISSHSKEEEQPFVFDPILNRWDNFLIGILGKLSHLLRRSSRSCSTPSSTGGITS